MSPQDPSFRIPPKQNTQAPLQPKFWQDKRNRDLLAALILVVVIIAAYASGFGRADENCLPSEVQKWVDATNRITTQSTHVDEIFNTPGEIPKFPVPIFNQDNAQIADEFEAAYRRQLELEPPPCLAAIHQYALDIYLYHWGIFNAGEEDEIEENYQLASQAVEDYNQERLRLIEEGILDR